jgi:hypothetical protein
MGKLTRLFDRANWRTDEHLTLIVADDAASYSNFFGLKRNSKRILLA